MCCGGEGGYRATDYFTIISTPALYYRAATDDSDTFIRAGIGLFLVSD